MDGWIAGLSVIGVVVLLWLWVKHTMVIVMVYLLGAIVFTVYAVAQFVEYHQGAWWERAGWGFFGLVLCVIGGAVGLGLIALPMGMQDTKKPATRDHRGPTKKSARP